MEEYQMKKSKTNVNELNNKNVNEEDEIVAYVVSAETMEITDTFRYGDSYKKKTKEDKKKILEFLAQEDECEVFNDGVSFVKLYDDILDELNKHLSLAEFNFTIRLAKHVSFRDCILRTNGNPHGKILDAKDIAALLQISYRNYQRYEKGEIDPPTSKTLLLAEFYNVSLDYLVGLTNNSKPYSRNIS